MTEPHTPTAAELAQIGDEWADENARNRRHSPKTGPSAELSPIPVSTDPDSLNGSQGLTDRFGWRRHPRIQEQP